MKESLIRVIHKIKTPITLAGLVVAVLCIIYKSIIEKNIFSQINSDNTFLFFQNTVNKLFYLALVAIVLGILSYIASLVIEKKRTFKSSGFRTINFK